MEQEEKKPIIYHKIEAGKKIRVFKSTYQEKTFYKVQVTQTNYDKTQDKFYIGVVFKKGVELNDPDGKGIDIIIKQAVENFRKNPKDEYNPIMYLMITEFEICEREEQQIQQAYDNFRDNLNQNELSDEDPFY